MGTKEKWIDLKCAKYQRIIMKSLNFHTEMSILTFLLLWTVAQFEELKDVQVKIIKEAKKPCLEDPSRMADKGDHLEVHYVGRLNDENGEKFDASRDRGQLFKFQ